MTLGDVVIVTGKMDTRVRDKDQTVLIKGTVFHVYGDNYSVLLENGDIYEGTSKDVHLAEEHE